MVELYLAGKLRLDDLITRRYSIDEANEGFRDLASGALSESVVLTAGIGEAYTPTIIGPDGTVYAINDATLFAVGE